MDERTSESTWSRLRQHRAVRWAMDILLFGGLFLGVMYVQTRHHLAGGEEAPGFRLASLDGDSHDLSEFHDSPTVLFFWAPWCGVCKADAHNIADLKEAYGEEIDVVSVVLDFRDLESVRTFVDENAVPSPVLLGDRGVAEAYEVDAYPTVYLLDSDGRIATSTVGYTTELGLRARIFWHTLF